MRPGTALPTTDFPPPGPVAAKSSTPRRRQLLARSGERHSTCRSPSLAQWTKIENPWHQHRSGQSSTIGPQRHYLPTTAPRHCHLRRLQRCHLAHRPGFGHPTRPRPPTARSASPACRRGSGSACRRLSHPCCASRRRPFCRRRPSSHGRGRGRGPCPCPYPGSDSGGLACLGCGFVGHGCDDLPFRDRAFHATPQLRRTLVLLACRDPAYPRHRGGRGPWCRDPACHGPECRDDRDHRVDPGRDRACLDRRACNDRRRSATSACRRSATNCWTDPPEPPPALRRFSTSTQDLRKRSLAGRWRPSASTRARSLFFYLAYPS
mmetsp:Transcript_69608/g.193692  ORF Transcript_69608/g.193692 Transcript_69608/m.193692 type:complete len:321 (-) Transcript_69608:1300-2262(-)